jgi:hypothetical protein
VVHYLLGRFGQAYGGRQYPIAMALPTTKIVIQAPHYDRTFADWFSNPEEITFTRDWAGTLEALEGHLPDNPRVAVIPTATMQYYDS